MYNEDLHLRKLKLCKIASLTDTYLINTIQLRILATSCEITGNDGRSKVLIFLNSRWQAADLLLLLWGLMGGESGGLFLTVSHPHKYFTPPPSLQELRIHQPTSPLARLPGREFHSALLLLLLVSSAGKLHLFPSGSSLLSPAAKAPSQPRPRSGLRASIRCTTHQKPVQVTVKFKHFSRATPYDFD